MFAYALHLKRSDHTADNMPSEHVDGGVVRYFLLPLGLCRGVTKSMSIRRRNHPLI
jgi:hypothetical protein